jgi:hypothetical protein
MEEKKLKNKLKSYVEIFNKTESYPVSFNLYGFGSYIISNQLLFVGRIRELCEVLNYEFIMNINDKKIKIEVKENGR